MDKTSPTWRSSVRHCEFLGKNGRLPCQTSKRSHDDPSESEPEEEPRTHFLPPDPPKIHRKRPKRNTSAPSTHGDLDDQQEAPVEDDSHARDDSKDAVPEVQQEQPEKAADEDEDDDTAHHTRSHDAPSDVEVAEEQQEQPEEANDEDEDEGIAHHTRSRAGTPKSTSDASPSELQKENLRLRAELKEKDEQTCDPPVSYLQGDLNFQSPIGNKRNNCQHGESQVKHSRIQFQNLISASTPTPPSQIPNPNRSNIKPFRASLVSFGISS